MFSCVRVSKSVVVSDCGGKIEDLAVAIECRGVSMLFTKYVNMCSVESESLELTQVAATVEHELLRPTLFRSCPFCPFADDVILLNVAGVVASEIWVRKKANGAPPLLPHWPIGLAPPQKRARASPNLLLPKKRLCDSRASALDDDTLPSANDDPYGHHHLCRRHQLTSHTTTYTHNGIWFRLERR